MEDEYPIYDRKALPWEDKGASRKEIRRCKRLHRKILIYKSQAESQNIR